MIIFWDSSALQWPTIIANLLGATSYVGKLIQDFSGGEKETIHWLSTVLCLENHCCVF